MSVEVRPCATKEELVDAAGAITFYFGGGRDETWPDRWLRNFELDRMLAAFVEGAIVGGAGAFTFDLTVPGGMLPCAGVTIVGVLPTHRRRGILRAMMRAQLDDVRERGEPLALLWASEAAIYRRFGYGLASLSAAIEVPRERTAFREPLEPAGRLRHVGFDEALELFPQAYDRVQRATPGMFARGRSWWEARRLYDPENRRQGGGEHVRSVLEVDGRVDGYALYRLHWSMDGGVATTTMNVIEAVAATPEATAALWRYLLDVDWVATIKADLLPVDHPLLLLLAEPRRAGFRLGDALWLRLVDVGAALSGRGYARDGRIVLDVRDSFCPWNDGRWTLEGGEARRGGGDADLSLDVQDLASVYLGGFTFAELGRAGRVEEVRPGAVRDADELFRSEVAPWCPEIF